MYGIYKMICISAGCTTTSLKAIGDCSPSSLCRVCLQMTGHCWTLDCHYYGHVAQQLHFKWSQAIHYTRITVVQSILHVNMYGHIAMASGEDSLVPWNLGLAGLAR